MGNVKYETPKPNNLAPHASPRPAYEYLEPYQKINEAGKE
jgi:hypothetical protein